MRSGLSQKLNRQSGLMIGGLLLATGVASWLIAPSVDESQPESVRPVAQSAPIVAPQTSTIQPQIPTLSPYPNHSPPNFADLDVAQKKQAFAEFIQKRVAHYNAFILQERAWVHRLKNKSQWSLAEQKAFKALTEKYRFKRFNIGNAQDWHDLWVRIDTIPEALAIAQGANESAWGTSRFARLGNNYFGQWCFRKGCGIEPNARTEGMTHEVRKFNNAFYSVKAYIDNLNTHPAYRKLRQIRAQKRNAQIHVKATDLTPGLERYSERGMEYVETLNQMIRFNQWE